jgi:hypothetical protein
MDTTTLFFMYMTVILLSICASLANFKVWDKASKIIILLLGLTFLAEATAYVAAEKLRTNMFVYHIFAPIQLLVIGKYFDAAVFTNKKIGQWIGLFGIAAAISNSLFLQPIEMLNSNFLLFEGLAVMGMSLYSFQPILSDARLDIYKYVHFWFILILVFFWSMTYTIWALYAILELKKIFLIPFISLIILAVNIITYFGIGVVFLMFPKHELRSVR